MARSVQIVFDCADPDRLAHFWAQALGYQVQPPPPGFESWEAFLLHYGVEDRVGQVSAITDPERNGPRLYFQRVPEPKSTKNRLHLDVHVSAGGTSADERREALIGAADHLADFGALVIQRFEVEESGEQWIVMQDPEGNEFCLT